MYNTGCFLVSTKKEKMFLQRRTNLLILSLTYSVTDFKGLQAVIAEAAGVSCLSTITMRNEIIKPVLPRIPSRARQVE